MAHRNEHPIDFNSPVYFGNNNSQNLTTISSCSPAPFSDSYFSNNSAETSHYQTPNQLNVCNLKSGSILINNTNKTNSHISLNQQVQIQRNGNEFGYLSNSCSFSNPNNDFKSSHPTMQQNDHQNFVSTSTPLKLTGMFSNGATCFRSLEDYYKEAQEKGYIYGPQLDKVLLTFPRSNLVVNNRILSQFKNLYGEVNSKTRGTYIQLGVRVPTKEHVSEIVGKGGNKIKELREKTGALIVTPNEQADHVFIIEALPDVALSAANYIKMRAEEITLAKSGGDRRRGSFGASGQLFSSIPNFSGTNGASALSSSLSAHKKNLVKDKISVPQDLVGKIIGTQGSIITTIQRDTGTEIRSPPKDSTRDPKGYADFEIACYEGPQLTIEEARRRIYTAKQFIAHLVIRQFEKFDIDDDLLSNEPDWNKQPVVVSDLATVISNHWKWPDIQPMPVDEARIVIDRILTESKSKTRRESPENVNSESSSQLFFTESLVNRTLPNMHPSTTANGFLNRNYLNGTVSCDSDYNGFGLPRQQLNGFSNSTITPRNLGNRMISSTSKALILDEQNGLDIRHNSLGARFYSTSKSTEFNAIQMNLNSTNVRSSIPECLEGAALDSNFSRLSLNNPSFSLPLTSQFKPPLQIINNVVRSDLLILDDDSLTNRSNTYSNNYQQPSIQYHQLFNDSGFESLNSGQQPNFCNLPSTNAISYPHLEEYNNDSNNNNSFEINNLYNIFKFPDEEDEPTSASINSHSRFKRPYNSFSTVNTDTNNSSAPKCLEFEKNGLSLSSEWAFSENNFNQGSPHLSVLNSNNLSGNLNIGNINNSNDNINNHKSIGCIGDGRKKSPSPQ